MWFKDFCCVGTKKGIWNKCKCVSDLSGSPSNRGYLFTDWSRQETCIATSMTVYSRTSHAHLLFSCVEHIHFLSPDTGSASGSRVSLEVCDEKWTPWTPWDKRELDRRGWESKVVDGKRVNVRERQGRVWLLWGLRSCAFGFAVLARRWRFSPVAAVVERRRAGEVLVVVEAVGGIVLRVLQPRDQPLVLITKLSAHQSGLAHYHHVLPIIHTKRGGVSTFYKYIYIYICLTFLTWISNVVIISLQ